MEQENISDQISEVRQLLSQLKIIEEEKETYEHKNYNIDDDKEEVVYGYESEDDLPFRMKLEEIPESTSGHKRRREFYHNDYMNEKGYTKQNDKWKKFPDEYTPSIKTNIDILNLDCVQNKEEALTLWMNNTGLLIQLEKIFQNFNPNLVWTFVTYKVTGSVKNYLQTLSQAQIDILLREKTINSEVFFTLVDTINREFLGKDDVDKKKATEAAEAEKALWHLNNIQICNICWLCNEEGHYANKCPNKKKTENKEKLKILNIAIENCLEPIEDSDSEIEEIYELLSDSSQPNSSEEEYSSSDE
ncbi:uncharacterized protein [Rutidosis leptorrhynchoides]|uniref:uncharacterized protein n=1 Tax=Rutidosis leptorrhynchoides TaxID=125765 RepID=UPI003A99D9AF